MVFLTEIWHSTVFGQEFFFFFLSFFIWESGGYILVIHYSKTRKSFIFHFVSLFEPFYNFYYFMFIIFFFSIFTVHCLLLLFILPLCSFHFSTVHYPFTVFIFQFIVVLKPPIVLMPLTEFFKLDTWLNIFIYIYLIYIFKYLPNLIYSYQFFASIFWCALNSESALALISYQSQWTLGVHCTSKCLSKSVGLGSLSSLHIKMLARNW